MTIKTDTTPHVGVDELLVDCLNRSMDSYLKLLETFGSPKAYRELGSTIRCLVVAIKGAESGFDEMKKH